MNKFVIMTEVSCDFPESMITELGLEIITLDVIVDGEAAKNVRELDVREFYASLRGGKNATTAASNIDQFIGKMQKILDEGKDILYLGFSSGLSGTYNAGFVAAKEMSEKYPDRKIITVDTLCASMGQGLLVWYAAKMRDEGADIESVAEFVEKNKLNLCHWFTVDDLMFLKRGGRISAATAVMGTMLNIKPVLHMDNNGKLISVSKARGRKASIDALFAKMLATAIDLDSQTIFISHGDCEADAIYLADKIKNETGVKDVIISYVGPVIGAHSGPGTLALFFLGTER